MKAFKEELIVDDTKILDVPIEHMLHEPQLAARPPPWTPRQRPAPAARLTSVVERDGLRKDAIFFKPRSAPVSSPQRTTSRFGEEWERAFRPTPVNFISRGLRSEEVEYFLRLHRLDELNAREVRGMSDIPPVEVRSPSPEPVYDAGGRRINGLEQRFRDAERIERGNLVEQCQRLSPNFLTPRDWRPLRRAKKIYLPAWEGNELSLAAGVMGARGRTQKLLEEMSGCRVALRRASTSEPAHVLVAAENDDELERGVSLVLRLLEGEAPHQLADAQSRFVRIGYEALAVETVLRDRCANCQEEGHKTWNCPYAREGSQSVVAPSPNPFSLSSLLRCAKCGRKNHLTRDCRATLVEQTQTSVARDEEYAAFLREVGVEGGAPDEASRSVPWQPPYK